MMSNETGVKAQKGLAAFLLGGFRPAVMFLALYFAASVILRLSLPNSLTLDEAEQSLVSQYWLLGYGPQPPFFNWLQHLFVDAIGISVLALALPKYLTLLLCYVFYGLAAREIDQRPSIVAFAMMSLLTLPQVSYMPQQDLTHTIAVLMATALFLFGLFRTLQRPSLLSYTVLGIAIGIGTISKYNFVLLPAAAMIAVFCDAGWRRRLFDWRVLVTAVLALAIILPHAAWLVGHLTMATAGTLSKMIDANAPHGAIRILKAFLSLVLACIAFGALSVVALAIAARVRGLAPLSSGTDRFTRLVGRMMLLSLAGVVIVILVAGTTKITERWLDPYLLVLPLYLVLKLDRAGFDMPLVFKRLVPFFVVLMVVTLIPLAGRTLTAGLTGASNRINIPFADAADRLRGEAMPVAIIADGMHLAGNMRMQFPDLPVINGQQAVGTFPDRLVLGSPILVVWYLRSSQDTGVAPDLSAIPAAQGRRLSPPETLHLPYYFSNGREQLDLGYAWLR
jgi:lipopolysaccharide core galacturonosyltransferase RgtA